MSKIHVFPYGITLRDGGIIDIFPAAEVTFKTLRGERVSLFFVIDSGAVISALPKSDALVFGIDIERGAQMMISGIGGNPVRGWRHELTVGLGKDLMRIPMVFLDDDQAPRVLGRAGIFNRYTVIFEEYKKRSAMMCSKTKTSHHITKILNELSKKE